MRPMVEELLRQQELIRGHMVGLTDWANGPRYQGIASSVALDLETMQRAMRVVSIPSLDTRLAKFSQEFALLTGSIRTAVGTTGIGAVHSQQLRLNELSRSLLPSVELLSSIHRATAAIHAAYLPSNAVSLASIAALEATASLSFDLSTRITEEVKSSALPLSERSVLRGLHNLERRSTQIWDEFAVESADPSDAAGAIFQSPIVQVFGAAQSTALRLTGRRQLADYEPAAGIMLADATGLIQQLRDIRPALADTYLGALSAFERKGPDYVRQVSASLRELMFHLLRILAPDEELKNWDQSLMPKDGKITNKARLIYVFRRLASTAYATMTAKDIDHVLQSFFPLNDGVHRLEPELEDEHVRSLIRRCEYDLLVVLEAHRYQ